MVSATTLMGLGCSIVFGFLRMISLPKPIAWGGVVAGLATMAISLLPEQARPNPWQIAMYAIGIALIAIALAWQLLSRGQAKLETPPLATTSDQPHSPSTLAPPPTAKSERLEAVRAVDNAARDKPRRKTISGTAQTHTDADPQADNPRYVINNDGQVGRISAYGNTIIGDMGIVKNGSSGYVGNLEAHHNFILKPSPPSDNSSVTTPGEQKE